jgi:hypothetical protein
MRLGEIRLFINVEAYEVGHRSNKRGVNLISDALIYSPLWYRGPSAIRDAIDYAKCRSRSRDAVIRVYDEAGNVIETHALGASSKSGEFIFVDVSPAIQSFSQSVARGEQKLLAGQLSVQLISGG